MTTKYMFGPVVLFQVFSNALPCENIHSIMKKKVAVTLGGDMNDVSSEGGKRSKVRVRMTTGNLIQICFALRIDRPRG